MNADGYLVPYKARPIASATNPLYKGVDGIPPHPPSNAAHESAVWMLNFEIDKNDFNMLQTVNDARKVRDLFLKSGCAEIEIVYCKSG